MDTIILSNTIILLSPLLILERDPEKMNTVTLHVPGLPEPHLFEGSDAHELWRAFDDRAPEWK